MVVKEIKDGLLEEIEVSHFRKEKFGWWFEQDIDGENEDGNEKKLVMVQHAKQSLNVINDSDNEEVDQVIELETNSRLNEGVSKDDKGHPGTSKVMEGASTPIKDSTAGSSRFDISMREFKECVEEIKVMDVVRTGLQFTWNQKPKGNDGILKKIDRIMGNLEFNDTFLGAHAIFMPYRIPDHALAILKIPLLTKMEQRPFKFTNLLVHDDSFKSVVQEGWSMQVSEFFMFQVVQKLKLLKKPLRKLLFVHGNLRENVKKLRFELDQVQIALDSDPFNCELRTEEAAYVHAFNDALLMEERFLKQKSNIDWLKLGDSNTAYFHKAVKSCISRSRIEAVIDSNGMLLTNDQVADGFVKHYEAFLGQTGHTGVFNMDGLFRNVLD
ncbi:hypothetical protein Tco_1325956, partial [Tanacetum coccineum]